MENKNSNHLKEIVEIVGVVSIVTSLLLVAWEIRHTNRITSTQTVLQLAGQLEELDRDRSRSSSVAKLVPKLRSPESHLVTATESAQMEGLASRYINILAAAQTAYDARVMDREQYARYSALAESVVADYPGLHPYLVQVTDARGLGSLRILQPIADLSAQQATQNQ